MGKMTKILKNVGQLIHGGLKETMTQTLNSANLESEFSEKTVKKWEKEFEMFKATVDTRIKEQKHTYNSLDTEMNKLNGTLESFQKGLDRWKAEQIVKAAFSLMMNIAGMFAGKPPDLNDAWDTIEKTIDAIKNVMKTISNLAEIMETIRNAFSVNVKYDVSALDDIKFEPTLDFNKALEQGSTFLERSADFFELEKVAKIVLPRVDAKTKNGVDEIEDLMSVMTTIAKLGNDLVNQVNISHTQKILGSMSQTRIIFRRI